MLLERVQQGFDFSGLTAPVRSQPREVKVTIANLMKRLS